MNHPAPIGSFMPLIAPSAPVLGVKPVIKGVAPRQFLQAMLTTMQRVVDAKPGERNPCDLQANGATPGGRVQAPLQAELVTDAAPAVAALHPEASSTSLSVPIPIVLPTKAVEDVKLQGTPVAMPATATGSVRKNVHKEGVIAAPESAPVPEGAAPILAVVPRELPSKPVSEAVVENREALPESSVAVSLEVAKGAKNSEMVAAGKITSGKSEGRPTEGTIPANSHPLRDDPLVQRIPSVPVVAVHDAVHSVRDGSMPASGVAAIGSTPSSIPHPPLVGKTQSMVGPHLEATSAATDLRTLVATPNVLEVGIASGAHGWLKIRAEFGQTGEVAASVLAGSASAAQSLHRELPGISAYLSSERVGVSSLVINSAERGIAAQGSVLTAGSGGSATTGDGPSHGGKDPPTATAKGASGDTGVAIDTSALVGLVGMNLPLVLHANGSGSWLSVRV